jgi:hypothetical protein
LRQDVQVIFRCESCPGLMSFSFFLHYPFSLLCRIGALRMSLVTPAFTRHSHWRYLSLPHTPASHSPAVCLSSVSLASAFWISHFLDNVTSLSRTVLLSCEGILPPHCKGIM